jgi:Na+-transporting methylmalonyl-CoA/oxaloacetate decarboxylase gamma subunit
VNSAVGCAIGIVVLAILGFAVWFFGAVISRVGGFERKCPHCLSYGPKAAKVCRKCHRDI